ncbi:MAG: KPN_02809 family neutral zinc metallopeptidase [Gemmatimonadaceae bacterium]
MRWTPGGRSRNLEDRRGSGGGMGMPMGIGGTVVLLVLSLLFGRNLFNDVGVQPGQQVTTSGGALADSAAEEPQVQFVSFVLDNAQQTWSQVLPREANVPWQDAKVVLFRQVVQSGCGRAQSAMGPFYCPLDQKVYVDLGFYDDLRSRFGAPGDFAQAYVLAHEIGHHVQHLMGTDERVRRAQRASGGAAANRYSVALELQADCYAGIWAYHTNQQRILEQGDVEEGLAAAAAVGDDRIQQQSTGSVNPESFTHGSSAQRASWFRRGYETGQMKSCDTFSG